MVRKRRTKKYGNILKTEFLKNYVNVWTNNKEYKGDLELVSMLLLSEGTSLVQIILCEDELYNGLYHIKTFKFDTLKEPTLVIEDLEDLHNPKRQDFRGLVEQVFELSEKHDILIPKDIDFKTNPLKEPQQFKKLIMG